MQINNNPLSFKSVIISDPAMKVLNKRMAAKECMTEIQELKNKYMSSPVTLRIDVFDAFNPRLDAVIFCDKDCKYIIENFLSYLLDLNPKKFLKKSAIEVENMEKKFI